MKTHYLIFLSTAVITGLFYEQDFGVNFGLVGVLFGVLTFIKTKKRNRTREFMILFVLTMFSSIAFAWYGDFVSFVAVMLSLLFLIFKARNKRMKAILAFPIMVMNNITFPCRFFDFGKWIPKSQRYQFSFKSFLMLLFPVLFFVVFFMVYSQGSSLFSEIYLYKLDINIYLLFVICVSFYFSFNYWNFSVAKFYLKRNRFLQNEFSKNIKNQYFKSFVDFLDLDTERKSGVLTFISLNALLLIFVITFNYEQFFGDIQNLSNETHNRVYVVILSIIMAIFILQFYFKSYFNFDEKAGLLKKLAKIWIILNGLLVLSAILKNAEYVYNLGLTYKRLGVFAFLVLCIIGLFFSFKKIQHQKTNIYLYNQMVWYFYGTILVCSFFNWGYFITAYNIHYQKGNDYEFLRNLEYNDSLLLEYFPKEIKNDDFSYRNKIDIMNDEQAKSFLSKKLYYEFINTDL